MSRVQTTPGFPDCLKLLLLVKFKILSTMVAVRLAVLDKSYPDTFFSQLTLGIMWRLTIIAGRQ